jgi:hypothetical protein
MLNRFSTTFLWYVLEPPISRAWTFSFSKRSQSRLCYARIVLCYGLLQQNTLHEIRWTVECSHLWPARLMTRLLMLRPTTIYYTLCLLLIVFLESMGEFSYVGMVSSDQSYEQYESIFHLSFSIFARVASLLA